jgi:hypothetical protein
MQLYTARMKDTTCEFPFYVMDRLFVAEHPYRRVSGYAFEPCDEAVATVTIYTAVWTDTRHVKYNPDAGELTISDYAKDEDDDAEDIVVCAHDRTECGTCPELQAAVWTVHSYATFPYTPEPLPFPACFKSHDLFVVWMMEWPVSDAEMRVFTCELRDVVRRARIEDASAKSHLRFMLALSPRQVSYISYLADLCVFDDGDPNWPVFTLPMYMKRTLDTWPRAPWWHELRMAWVEACLGV